jgi:hypothetical protein
VVIDDFLDEATRAKLHEELLSDQMWRLKNPVSKHLHNSRPRTSAVDALLPKVDAEIKRGWSNSIGLIDYWALLYAKNTDGNVHADFGQLTLTYWLTPDHYNLEPATGGLILFDVRRGPEEGADRYLVAGKESERHVRARSSHHTVVPYRCNRAVLFDSSHYHKTHTPVFDVSTPQGMRMNLTLMYASVAHVEQQIRLIEK